MGALVGPIAEPIRPETAAVTSNENGGRTHAGGVFCLSYPTSDIAASKPGSDTVVMEVRSHNTELSWNSDGSVFPQPRALVGPIAEPNRPETAAVTFNENGVRTHAGGVFCLSYPTSDISARTPGSDTAVIELCFHNTELSWELSWDPSPSLIGPREML